MSKTEHGGTERKYENCRVESGAGCADGRISVDEASTPGRPRRWPGVDPRRSKTMSAVGKKDTKPEIMTRRILHSLGYRYSLHGRHLPGNPDILFSKRRKAVFVHGCYWHGHDCKHGHRQSRSNQEYWVAKIARNRLRDAEAIAGLEQLGWKVEVVWECELKDRAALTTRLSKFLGPRRWNINYLEPST